MLILYLAQRKTIRYEVGTYVRSAVVIDRFCRSCLRDRRPAGGSIPREFGLMGFHRHVGTVHFNSKV